MGNWQSPGSDPMRKALIIGLDHYRHRRPLNGCVQDALAMRKVLAQHGDGRSNFACQMLLATQEASAVDRASLRRSVEALFSGNDGLTEAALLYFAGHGSITSSGGCLLSSEASDANDGLPLRDLMDWANQSKARHRLIFLDCCHSGAVAEEVGQPAMSKLADGVTVLTAATAKQVAMETDAGGLFTGLMVEALKGGAANLAGDVTPGGVYAFIDQSLGAWQQRPVFKTNVQQFISLRSNPSPIDLQDLRQITSLFTSRDALHNLDPSYEPLDAGRQAGDPPADPDHVRQFAILKAYSRLQLVTPVDAPDMWSAAMRNQACRLTPLGQHYWRLVQQGLL
jgi:hypothetical protein